MFNITHLHDTTDKYRDDDSFEDVNFEDLPDDDAELVEELVELVPLIADPEEEPLGKTFQW